MRYFWVVLLEVLLFLPTTRAEEVIQKRARPPRRTFSVPRATSPITVDGRLEEPAWDHARVVELPYEWQPGENVAPPVRTECLITYDRNYLFIAFRAYDPEPQKIRAHLMDRDQIETLIQDDYVGFMIDTFNDERRAYQFRVNALGVQAEALNSSGDEDWEWDLIWDSAGRITNWGYTVEIAVPWNQLRFPTGSGPLTFGFRAMRSWPRSVRHRIASHYTDYRDTCLFCQFDKITGFTDISPGHNLEFDPTLTASRSDHRTEFPSGPLVAGNLDVQPGISARWGITTGLILNATINPDFSQVEADVAQLEVNQRFALFFPEKRPFFLESMDFFKTPIQAIFTRSVADPVAGLKFTGKIGSHALGLFATVDRINNLILPSNQASSFASIDQTVSSIVFRFRRDLGRSSNLGVLYAGREATGYHNRVLGVDGYLQLARAHRIAFQYLHSTTRYPSNIVTSFDQPTDSFNGYAFTANYLHFSRTWLWFLEYSDLSPTFRADAGFVPRVDTRSINAYVQKTWWSPTPGWWTSFDVQFFFNHTTDHSGRLTDQRLYTQATYQGPWQSRLELGVVRDRIYFNGVTFDLSRYRTEVGLQPTGSWRLSFRASTGQGIDFVQTRRGRLVTLGPSLEWKPGRHVNVNLSHAYQKMTLGGRHLFKENLFQARLFYFVNVKTFLRLIVQYRVVNRNPDLYRMPVVPRSQRMFLQFLASYKLNPQTVLFLGYSDTLDGQRDLNLTRVTRTFFVKLGYAWAF